MHDISERLTKALPTLPKKLGIAARYALDCPERIALDSMRTVATSCNVASPTMLRLARIVGYNSYEDFRAEFQQNFVAQGFGTRADALKSAATLGEGDQLIDRIAQAATRNTAHAIQLLDASVVEEFAQSVKKSRRTYILGSGSSMHWMAAMMASVGEMALTGIRSNLLGLPTSLETIASIDSNDTLLVMSVSPYSRNSIEAAAFAKARKAKVFALTDKRSSPLLEHADRVFFAPTESPHYYPSVVSTVLMVEILLSAAVAASDTLDRIKQIELVKTKVGLTCDQFAGVAKRLTAEKVVSLVAPRQTVCLDTESTTLICAEAWRASKTDRDHPFDTHCHHLCQRHGGVRMCIC